MIFPPEPSKECVKVSHVIFECRVINHHPSEPARERVKVSHVIVECRVINHHPHKLKGMELNIKGTYEVR